MMTAPWPEADTDAGAVAWQEMRADGVPVAEPETEPGISPAHVPDPAPEAGAVEVEAQAEIA